MRARCTWLAGSVRERETRSRSANSSSVNSKSITPRAAAITSTPCSANHRSGIWESPRLNGIPPIGADSRNRCSSQPLGRARPTGGRKHVEEWQRDAPKALEAGIPQVAPGQRDRLEESVVGGETRRHGLVLVPHEPAPSDAPPVRPYQRLLDRRRLPARQPGRGRGASAGARLLARWSGRD